MATKPDGSWGSSVRGSGGAAGGSAAAVHRTARRVVGIAGVTAGLRRPAVLGFRGMRNRRRKI